MNAASNIEICNNSIDDDSDGLIDCYDPDCDSETNADSGVCHYVDTLAELYTAFGSEANNDIIVVSSGTYTLNTTALALNASNVRLWGATGTKEDVIIQGDAMTAGASIKYILYIVAANTNIHVKDLTMQRVGWHVVGFEGSTSAGTGSTFDNVAFKDAYEQIIKVADSNSTDGEHVDDVTITNSVIMFSSSPAPQSYTGGIDAHGAQDWIVRGNTFQNITSPDTSPGEGAVHFWQGSANNLVEKNRIIDCDRGIEFGRADGASCTGDGLCGNSAGIIRNNMIFHSGQGTLEDVQIAAQNSPNTEIYNNTIYMVDSAYANAIEGRWSSSTGLLIQNNLIAGGAIQLRDSSSGTVSYNVTNAEGDWFVDVVTGDSSDLHLAGTEETVIDQGANVSGLTDDYDGDSRQTDEIDIGADEA